MDDEVTIQKKAHNKKIAKIKQQFKEQIKDINIEIRIITFARNCFEEVIQLQKDPTKLAFHVPDDISLKKDKELLEKHLNIFGLSWNGAMATGHMRSIELNYYDS